MAPQAVLIGPSAALYPYGVNNIDVIRRLVDEVWNGGRTEVLDELFAEPFDHDGRSDTVGSLRDWQSFHDHSWSGTRYEIVNLISEGDTVAMRWKVTARHTGPWLDIPATGREVSWGGAHFFTLADGKIVAMNAVAGLHAIPLALGVTLVAP